MKGFSPLIYYKPEWPPFPESRSNCISYRIICELINNTIKHAGATMAIVKLKYSKSLLTLNYTDNGKGYDVGDISKRTGGMGVGNIIQRVNLIDAKIRFLRKKEKTGSENPEGNIIRIRRSDFSLFLRGIFIYIFRNSFHFSPFFVLSGILTD